MQTSKPTFDTLCVSQSYPIIKGECEIGVINIYNENYNLLKSVAANSIKFFINVDDVEFKAIVIQNIAIGKTQSEISNILTKCCEAVPCIKRVVPCTKKTVDFC